MAQRKGHRQALSLQVDERKRRFDVAKKKLAQAGVQGGFEVFEFLLSACTQPQRRETYRKCARVLHPCVGA